MSSFEFTGSIDLVVEKILSAYRVLRIRNIVSELDELSILLRECIDDLESNLAQLDEVFDEED